MSWRACNFFDVKNPGLVSTAKGLCEIKHINEHPTSAILEKYVGDLADKGVQYLLRRLSADWGKLSSKYLEEDAMPAAADIEDRTLQVLILLPPFGDIAPSENDVLALWVAIFSMLTRKVTIHTGEKAMLASKAMRQMQSAEYGDPSDSGRKTDCLFMFGDIELSNIEFKRPNISETDVSIQNRKNVRLGRCLQESHLGFGVERPNVLMADVSGYVGVFYQVIYMENIAVAGRATSHLVHLPSTEGALLDFLFSPSLAIMWNYVEHLEAQGPQLRRRKDRHEVMVSKTKLAEGLARPGNEASCVVERRFENNVVLSPPKKRTLQ
ncbi:hypothetical protein BGZ65_008057 [Modicella reniformis]|uniref:Uncharacterized protein n=1 Tax=Modicella reniformis TaxID=1440133 RepID=A0A9P6JGU4_9FUNG|nr:hypothetical protein BGZ65_008057 [Modicella reniformis]